MKRLVFVSALLFSVFTLLLSTNFASAAPTSFARWASATQTILVSNYSSNYSAWSTGATKWKNSTNFKVSTIVGSHTSNYYAYDVYDSNVDWDGIAKTTHGNGVITKSVLNFNTYYTSKSNYTASIKAGLAGHEIGHSLGLNHVSVVEISTNSIMYPYTFKSNGSPARALSPTSADITVVNNLYRKSIGSILSTSKEDGIYLTPSWSVYYEDEIALEKAADLVVRAKVMDNLGSHIDKNKIQPYTTQHILEIQDVIKGDIKEEKIVLSQMGGSDGVTNVFGEHTTLLTVNDEIIVFLKESEDGSYRPINEDDGIYVYKDHKGKFVNIRSKEGFSSLEYKAR